MAGALDAKTARKAAWAATIGNGLEFYDFVTFAFFAVQIGQAFFPNHDRYLSLMGSLATFGAGFISRPIGAYVLGGLADRVGRKTVLLLSMLLMGVGISVLALTPSYAAIGVAAPILVICARLIQGFALGGEIGSSTVYMLEAAEPHKRGFNVSLQAVSQFCASTLGALVGLALSSVLSEAQLADFGWRIALLLGVSVVPVALWMRRALPETLHVAEPPAEAFETPGPTARQAVVWGMVIMGAGTIATYIFNYTATFGQTELHMSAQASMAGQLAANGVGIVASLAGGWLCDRYGRRPLQIWPQIGFMLLIVPGYVWLLEARSLLALVTVNLVLSGLANLQNGAIYAAISESLPRHVRSRGFALIYALPVTLLGGSTQLFITWLLKVTGSPMSVAWYLTAIQVVGLIAMLALPESAPHLRRAKAVAVAA